MRAEAAAIGVATATYVDRLLAMRRHVEQGVRAAHGVVCLANRHGAAALEQACERALAAEVLAPRFVQGLLQVMLRPILPAGNDHGPAAATCAAPAITTEVTMLHQTIEKLHALKLAAMADGLLAQTRQPDIDALGFEERWRSWSTSSTRPCRTLRSGSG